MMSCNVTPMAAPTMLPRSSRVMPIAGSVFSPHSGISPKKHPDRHTHCDHVPRDKRNEGVFVRHYLMPRKLCFIESFRIR